MQPRRKLLLTAGKRSLSARHNQTAPPGAKNFNKKGPTGFHLQSLPTTAVIYLFYMRLTPTSKTDNKEWKKMGVAATAQLEVSPTMAH
jgi:hypothetical protein